MVGDFNIHINDVSGTFATDFLNITGLLILFNMCLVPRISVAP